MSGNQMILLGGSQAPAVDPYFYSVTSLLHGDGTNGGQNNTFLDSSTNNFTITRNGNTTQGSFSPFSQTGWSNYFDGTGDYLRLADNAAFTLGSGNFTIECWIYNGTTGARKFIAGQGNSAGQNISTSFDLRKTSGNKLSGTVCSGSTNYTATSSADLPLNQWTHVTFVRDGNTAKLFINGIQDGTVDVTGVTVNDSSNQFAIAAVGEYTGETWDGYISNFRLVKGTAVYTSNFTPPTTPLTAITNTSLLTCQSNRFIDNSSNAFAITVSGDTSIQPFSPFNPTTAYSTSAVGGSGYFDGSGDYLSMSDAGLAIGNGDFTLECWVYCTTTPSDKSIFEGRSGGTGTTGFTLTAFTGTTVRIFSGSALITSGTINYVNTWCHIAVSRVSGTTTLYVNGISQGTTTSLGNLTDSSFLIGAGKYLSPPTIDAFFTGYISNFRIVKGTAVYTANFSPPTAPLTAITNTQLLTNFTNGAIFDNAAVADYETVGNAQISTSVKKYGTGSMYFDGTGDYLFNDAPSTELFAFRGGDFTIEMWFYVNSFTNTYTALYDSRPSSTQGVYANLSIENNGTLYFYVNSNIVITSGSGLIKTGTWYHVAVCRAASQTKMFLNGTQIGSTYSDTNSYLNVAGRPVIGGAGFTLGNDSLNGYIDDLRVSKGVARYPYNFTPPTAEFPNIGGTVTLTADPYFDYTTLLLPGNGTNGAQNNTFLDSSTNAFSITRNGNTTQGTFSPFSQTGWGNYFDGTGDSLTLASNAAFALPGDFTFEAWIYPTSWSATFAPIFTVYLSSTGGFWVGKNGGNFVLRAAGVADQLTTTVFPTLDAWTHIAVVRSGTTATIYYNGTSVVSGTVTYSFAQEQANIASDSTTNNFPGYISNLRLVKGTAVYTSNFTPPTTPLTAITNTSLLTCQSNRFIDNSTNNFAITRNGDVSVQAFSPFNPTAAWSAATYGGSGYFDGSGDYLTIGTASGLNFGTGDFTLETWFYLTSTANTDQGIMSDNGGSFAAGSVIFKARQNFYSGHVTVQSYDFNSGGTPLLESTTVVVPNTWYHVAVVRSGNSFSLYVNGAREDTETFTGSINFNNNSGTNIGRSILDGASGVLTGYLSSLRAIKGTAQYSGTTLTVPTAPLTAITNTSLLCNFTNAGIYDATSKNDLETVGNAQISTTQSKFGGSSMYFDGTDDGLRFYEIINTQFGTGDFTVECWVYISSLASNQVICDARGSTVGTQPWQFYVNTSGKVVFNYGSNLVGGISVSTATWTHIAAARYGSTLRIFVNGVFDSSATTSASLNGVSGQPAYIGRVYDSPGSPYFNGYIDDLRITKGIARYTSNFTPPTTAFLTL